MLLNRTSLRLFSKYKKLDQAVTSLPKKEEVLPAEPIVAFKPKSVSFYESFAAVEPYRFPNFPLTPEREVPAFMYNTVNDRIVGKVKEEPANPRRATVAIWGPTNAGKSSIFNRLVGRKISAVSNKSFTTSDPIEGVVTDMESRSQLILYDLPGFSLSTSPRIKTDPRKEVRKALAEKPPTFVLLVADCNKRVDSSFQKHIDMLRDACPASTSFFLVLNKMDLCFNRRRLTDIVQQYEGLMNFEQKFFVSAETGFALDELTAFLQAQAPPDTWLYSPGIKTPMSEIEMAHEVIKSSIYSRFFKEFPYEIQYEVIEFVPTNDFVKVQVKLNCERPIHKRIVVGKEGKNLELLQNFIQGRLAEAYGREVKLELSIRTGLKAEQQKVILTDHDVRKRVAQEIGAAQNGADLKKLMK